MSEGVILAERALSRESVDDYLEAISESGKKFGKVELDWRALETVDPTAGAVVAAALLGSLRSVAVSVVLPNEQDRLTRITLGGLIFALAHRPDTHVVGNDHHVDLIAWRESWRFGAVDLPRNGNGHHGLYPDSRLNSVFINPHLAGSSSGVLTASQFVSPWLGRALADADRVTGRTVAESAAAIFNELVENVRIHAGSGRSERVPALALLSLSDDLHSLVLTVQDSGPGIAETARPKVKKGLKARNDDDSKLIMALFEGASLPWPNGRGLGLPRVKQHCEMRGASIDLISNRGRIHIAEWGTPRQTEQIYDSTFLLTGTVVTVAMPIRDPNPNGRAA
jgi:hypothetical protein